MNLLSNTSRMSGLSFMLTTIILVLYVSFFYGGAFGQENNLTRKYNILVTNQTYSSNFFSDQLVGEILNAGIDAIKAVRITAIFHDDQDDIVGSAYSGTTPSTINPGNTAIFNIEITDEGIKSNATGYEFTAKWKDEYLASSYFTRLIGGDISTDDDNEGGDDDVDDDDDDN